MADAFHGDLLRLTYFLRIAQNCPPRPSRRAYVAPRETTEAPLESTAFEVGRNDTPWNEANPSPDLDGESSQFDQVHDDLVTETTESDSANRTCTSPRGTSPTGKASDRTAEHASTDPDLVAQSASKRPAKARRGGLPVNELALVRTITQVNSDDNEDIVDAPPEVTEVDPIEDSEAEASGGLPADRLASKPDSTNRTVRPGSTPLNKNLWRVKNGSNQRKWTIAKTRGSKLTSKKTVGDGFSGSELHIPGRRTLSRPGSVPRPTKPKTRPRVASGKLPLAKGALPMPPLEISSLYDDDELVTNEDAQQMDEIEGPSSLSMPEPIKLDIALSQASKSSRVPNEITEKIRFQLSNVIALHRPYADSDSGLSDQSPYPDEQDEEEWDVDL